MKTNELRRAGHISMGVALVAGVLGAMSLMSVTSLAYGGSDDRGSDDRGSDDRGRDDRGSRSSDDGPGDDHGRRHGGHGADDGPGDDHGRRHGGHGADDGVTGSGVVLPLAQVAGAWEAQGYRILDISREDGSVVELDVIDPNGQRWEMYVDTANNAVLSKHRDD